MEKLYKKIPQKLILKAFLAKGLNILVPFILKQQDDTPSRLLSAACPALYLCVCHSSGAHFDDSLADLQFRTAQEKRLKREAQAQAIGSPPLRGMSKRPLPSVAVTPLEF